MLSRGSAAALSYCLPLHPSLATLAQLIESQLVNASRIAVDQQQSLPGYTLRENCREATSSCPKEDQRGLTLHPCIKEVSLKEVRLLRKFTLQRVLYAGLYMDSP